ncbi:MAG: hypothetical protein HY926_05750, partial [Elusimicrobia bacterium]|nr:hypothetical protein [Elusimicrobiota bacterium]
MSGRVGGLCNPAAWGYLARCLLTPRPELPFSLEAAAGRLLLVRRESADLEDAADAAAALAPLFADSPLKPAIFGDDSRQRLASLELLRAGSALALATPEALRCPMPSATEIAGLSVEFRVGTRLSRGLAVAGLLRAGYRKVDFVESPGEFAERGAILDFYGLEPLEAVRVLFDEDEVSSVRSVDPATQQTRGLVSAARAVCAAAPEQGAPLADWFGAGWTWIVEDGLDASSAPAAAAVMQAGPAGGGLDLGVRPNGPYVGDPSRAWDELKACAAQGWRAVLYSLNPGEDRRMQDLIDERFAGAAPCQFLVGPLRQGFHHPGHRLAVFSASEIFSRNYRPSLRWRRFTAANRGALRLGELKRGDFIVHQDYGLARFRGLEPVSAPGH